MIQHSIFAPYRFSGGALMKNRIVMAPMTTEQNHSSGAFSDEELRWLSMRAEGGFGMLISAAAHVRADGQSYAGQIACFSDIHDEGLQSYANAAKSHQALAILQLVHGGLRSAPAFTGVRPLAPSVVELNFPGFIVPTALDEAQIEALITSFAQAALRAQRAGLAGIELHAANGYLFTQFFSRATNLRTDQWGGSDQNRARFLHRTIAAIRNVVQPGFIVGVRLRAEDILPQRGFDIDDTLAIVAAFKPADVSYVHLAASDFQASSWRHTDDTRSSLSRVRTSLDAAIPLLANGGISTLQQAQSALAEGADMVALGKAAISTPDWPRQVGLPGFAPVAFPLPQRALSAAGASPKFIHYLRSFRIVAD